MTCARAFLGSIAFALLIAPGLPAQETELAAGSLFEKALENMTAQEGFHVRLGAEVSLGEGMAPMSITSTGWVRNPEIAYFKMSMGGMETETYRKGKQSVRRDATGEWQLEEDGSGGLGDQRLANPIEYLNEFKKYSKDAVYLDNDKVGEFDCRVIKADPPAEAIRGFIGGIGIPDAAIDWNKAKLTFRVWVDAKDVLVRQVIADLEVELAGLGGEGGLDDPAFDEDPIETKSEPKGDGKGDAKGDKKGSEDDFGFDEGDEFSQPMKLTPKAKFELFDYNKDVGLDKIPDPVKKKLKIDG